jgi:hypothetical protein
MNVDALYAALSVSVAFPDVRIDADDRLAVTPAGNPSTHNATVPVNPF